MGVLDRGALAVESVRRCKASVALDGLDADDQTMVAEELRGGRSIAAIHAWIAPHIIDLSTSSLTAHLRGRCCCDDGAPLRGAHGQT